MAKPVRVVLLINGLPRGGGETLLAEMLMWPNIQWQCYTLTRGGTLAQELRARGIVTRRLSYLGVPALWHWPRFLLDVWRADVLHSHFFYSDLVGATLRWLKMARRHVSTRHDMGTWMRPWQRRLERWCAKQVDRVIAVSQAVQESLVERGCEVQKIEILYPGVDVPPLQPVGSPGGFQVVSVGRLEHVKGHDQLLVAFQEVRAKLPQASLVIVGGGSAMGALVKQATLLGLGDAVTFAGMVPHEDIAKHLAKADLFVLPSRSEGLPVALLEAMAMGLAVIAFDVGGVGEVLGVDARVGVKLTPGDTSALAASMVDMLRDPERRRVLGTAARQHVAEHFSHEVWKAGHQEIYKHLQ